LEQVHFIECITAGREPIRRPEDDIAAMRIAKQIIDKIYTGMKK
jgi:hypothetical protein